MATEQQRAAASELLQNEQFMKIFERAMASGSGISKDGQTGPDGGIGDMPKEGDPRREAWLKNLQKKLQEESMRAAKDNLEQVQSDENGQWMYVLPSPGFCIKCAVAGGGKVFINVCQHERIAEPVPMSKEESQDLEEDEIRFRIPLSCGQARPEKDKSGRPCKVYDVIVNPATIKRCSQEHEFRRFVAALCMQWIKQKYEPTMNAEEFRNLNFKAKGTLEPQRIRLSAVPKATNAMQDEIKLPCVNKAPTAPSHAGGTKGSGKLIEEVDQQKNSGGSPPGSGPSSPAPAQSSGVVLASEAQNSVNVAHTQALAASTQPAVARVAKEGSYDWSSHKKPSTNVFFRDSVPAVYAVELFIPTIQTIREVDVRIGSKKVECFYVDEVDDTEPDTENTADPFLGVVFDYPVCEDLLEAKFVRRTHTLKLRFKVQLPDETDAARSAPARDAAEEEDEQQRIAKEEQEVAWSKQQEQAQRQQAEEDSVMAERKRYVENLSAVQSGDIPPLIRDEIDAMPKEQLPAMLHRLKGKIRKNDSVDKLFEVLPENVLAALTDYIRAKLSLAPEPRRSTETAPSQQSSSQGPSAPSKQSAAAPPSSATATPSTEQEVNPDDDARVEYNYAAKSEKLFGVPFYNRYLFALDN